MLPLGLSVGQQQFQLSLVRFVDDMTEPQASLAFSGLLGQNVARMGFPENKFSGTRFLETLGRRAIGFYFRHFCILSTVFFS